MNATYVYFVIFFCLAYLILTDQSIAKLFQLFTYYVSNKFQRFKWWILYSPDNFIVRWKIHRNSLRLAKELQKEFEKNSKN